MIEDLMMHSAVKKSIKKQNTVRLPPLKDSPYQASQHDDIDEKIGSNRFDQVTSNEIHDDPGISPERQDDKDSFKSSLEFHVAEVVVAAQNNTQLISHK